MSRRVDFGHGAPERHFLVGIDLGQFFGHLADGGAFAGDAQFTDFPVHARFDLGIEAAIACEDFCFCHQDTPKKKVASSVAPILSNFLVVRIFPESARITPK